jgi:hypothetical protein
MYISILLAEYIIDSKNSIMTKSLFILTLILANCGSGSSSIETKQNIVSDTAGKHPQTVATSQKETADSSFLKFWEKFTNVAKAKNQQAFVTMAFDSLQCEGKSIPVNIFMKSYFSKVFDDSLFAALSDRNKLDFISDEIDASYLPKSTRKQVKAGKCIEKTVNITTVNKYPPVIIMFKFIETKNGYTLYAYDRIG